MFKITIIVPIYNCEKDIEQCIRSVFAQTLKELEIICVDDGSTDRSAEIVKRLGDEDERVILFRQENQGAGAARNMALEKARGKYAAFLDADDYYMDSDALELMFEASEREGLFACAGLRRRIIDGTAEPDPLFQKTVKGVVLNYSDYQLDYNFQDFIFLREVLIKNGFSFPQYRWFEDPPFLARALYAAGRFMVVDTYLYCYRWTKWDSRFDSRKAYDLLCGLIDNLTFAREHGLEILFENTTARLEYEYMGIILKNIAPDDLGILKLLMKAGQIICDQTGRPDYVIRPLRAMLLHESRYEEKLLQRLQEQDEIVLYGAGRYGQAFLAFLKSSGLLGKAAGIAVSDLNGNKAQIEGIPVIALRDLQQAGEKPMFVTVGEKIQQEVKKYLDRNGYKNYEMVRDEFLYMISEEIDC